MFDLHRIDISGMRTKLIQSKDILKYIAILSNVKSKHLQLKTGFEIEILNKTYYVIKDFEDGNYLSIDEKGGVYGMFHDPFEIEQVSDSVVEFVDKINKGVFSIDKYYESKFK
jgi:IS4 transposase